MTAGTPTIDAAKQEPVALRPRPNWPLVMIAAVMAPVGLQAALLPRSFFDDFPIGRRWIAATGGGYNEHLARDVGVLFLSLVLATVWTAVSRAGDHALAVAWILQGVTHLAFHTAHLRGLGWFDATSLIVSLVAVPVLAVVALRYPTSRKSDRETIASGSARRATR